MYFVGIDERHPRPRLARVKPQTTLRAAEKPVKGVRRRLAGLASAKGLAASVCAWGDGSGEFR